MISAVEERGVERSNSHGKSHDLLLQLSDVPVQLCLELDLLGDTTDFIFNGTKLGMIWQPWDDIETMRTRTCGDGRVDVRPVVGGQIKLSQIKMRLSSVMAMPLTLISLQTY